MESRSPKMDRSVSVTPGYDFFSVARRFDTGWKTRAALPRGEGNQGLFLTDPISGLGF